MVLSEMLMLRKMRRIGTPWMQRYANYADYCDAHADGVEGQLNHEDEDEILMALIVRIVVVML